MGKLTINDDQWAFSMHFPHLPRGYVALRKAFRDAPREELSRFAVGWPKASADAGRNLRRERDFHRIFMGFSWDLLRFSWDVHGIY